MEKDFILKIREILKRNSNEKIRESGRRFFKEEVRMYGMKTADVSRIAEEKFKELAGEKKNEIFSLCEELFGSGFMEERFIACDWAYRLRDVYEERDFAVFENWLEKYIDNWATCDTLCNHTIGSFIEKYPEYSGRLKEWARSDNRWLRRAAAVTLIIPARKGKFLKEIFEIADILFLDADDMVQKGYGWMLKEASKADQKAVFDYVMKNRKKMPRTALRYAIEKMPKDLRAKAMAK